MTESPESYIIFLLRRELGGLDAAVPFYNDSSYPSETVCSFEGVIVTIRIGQQRRFA